MSSRTVHTCDRCGEDFSATPGSREEATLRGTVTLVPVRVGYALSDVVSLAGTLSVSLVRAGAKDLCQQCSDALRDFLLGKPLMGETRGDA